MDKLYCPECNNYLMCGTGECVDCYCGWKQEAPDVSDLQEQVDSLTAQRDEGLAREAELQAELASAKADKEAYGHNAVALRLRVNQLKQRLTEAETLLRHVYSSFGLSQYRAYQNQVTAFLASPGCADGEKADD